MAYGLQVFTGNGLTLFDSENLGYLPIDEFTVAAGASGSKSYEAGWYGYSILHMDLPLSNSSGGHVVWVSGYVLNWLSYTGIDLFPPTTTSTQITVFAR